MDLDIRCIVDINERTCTCRVWQVIGLPCTHAASFIGSIRQAKWENYVDCCYTTTTYLKAYRDGISPMPDKSLWEKAEDSPQVKPPEIKPQVGRPKNKRI